MDKLQFILFPFFHFTHKSWSIQCFVYFNENKRKIKKKAFARNSDFLTPVSLQPHVVDLWKFKRWILLDQIVQVWNIKGFTFWLQSYKS